MKIIKYQIKAPVKLKAAFVADLHGRPTEALYTKGVYHEKLIVSAGLTNTTWVFNPTELVILQFGE